MRGRLLLLLLPVLLAGGPAPAGPGEVGPRADAAGAIRTWIWHFDPRIAEQCVDTWTDLLDALPADVRILVALPSAREIDYASTLLGTDGRLDPRIELLDAGGSISLWARDPYLVFARADELCIAVPRGDPVLHGREGDRTVAAHLADIEPGLSLVETPLALEGGNVLLLRDAVLIGGDAIDRNARLLGWPPERVRAELTTLFGRRVVPVGADLAAPPHPHLDMYLAAADESTLLLADPSLCSGYFEKLADLGLESGSLGEGATFTASAQLEGSEAYTLLAEELAAEGFTVERIPILRSVEGDLVTWTNAVMEERNDRRLVYLPAYGIPLLDRAAQAAWRKLGYEPSPIRARKVIREGGAVRCVTNALHRVDDDAQARR